MLKEYTYLLIDLGCILIPLLASFHPKSPFYKEWKWYLPANFFVAISFLIWDAAFTAKGFWGFNEQYLCGVRIYNLPLEEILFFVCIPYACLYTFYVWDKYNLPSLKSTNWLSYSLASILLILAVSNYNRAYTSITFSSLALLLLYLQAKKMNYLGSFFVVYVIILLPFFVSNGLLTGSGLKEPIVWYNDEQNLGIRMLTIPVEDAFYAMLMLLMNLSVYKWLAEKAGGYKTTLKQLLYDQ
ncbi:MAG: lycopene cyclase domain-containing protein [Chitinophagaceae bacterium]|nr:lycopene cyclase domain-containing protein [Chitinophagaceae bacterium]